VKKSPLFHFECPLLFPGFIAGRVRKQGSRKLRVIFLNCTSGTNLSDFPSVHRTAIGIKCVDGCVLGVEKVLLSALLKKGSNRQLHTLGSHQGMAFSGWAPDARQLIDQGRQQVHSWDETYGSVIPPEVLAQQMAEYVHYFTLHGALRPFGVGAIVAGFDPETNTHALHMIEPNGVQYRYFGCALGKVSLP
jgi:20S proteasome subunit alpha 7